MHIIDAEVAEGLFADTVVLVEGVCDRAAIVAAAALEDIDLEAQGIAVLAVDGKTKMDRPAAIFTSLGIPTYLVWDCDRQPGGAVEGLDQNRALQALMAVPGDQIVDAATILAPTFACFETKLETMIKDEIGAEFYNRQLDVVKTKYGIERADDAEKAPFAMQDLLRGATARRKRSGSLRAIVKAIQALREAAVTAEIAPSGKDSSAGEDAAITAGTLVAHEAPMDGRRAGA